MANCGLLLAVYTTCCLLNGVLSQHAVEGELECCQSSNVCSGSNTRLGYSQCCADGSGSFRINNTSYACSELLSFEATSYTANEGDQVVNIEVLRAVNPNTSLFFFHTVIMDGSALAGVDYGQFPDTGIGLANIMLPDESVVWSGILIREDSIVEYNETFTVGLLHLASDFTPLGSITAEVATVTIIDNDKVDIGLTPSQPVVVMEENGTVLTYTLNKTGVAVRNVEVIVNLSDPELVYHSGGYSDIQIFTFEPETFKIMIQVMVPDDDIVEETEEHHVILQVPDGETGVNLLQESVIIMVVDDDVLDITLEVSERTVNEESGSVQVAIRKNGANERSVFVRVSTESGTAEGNVDFTPVDMEVEFRPEDEEHIVQVNVSRDGVVEDDESFLIKLEVPPTEKGVRLVQDTTTVVLQDSDFITVSVDMMEISLPEDGMVVLTISEEGALAKVVAINLQLSSTRDVNLSSDVVFLSSRNSNANVTIRSVDDNFYEGPESVDLRITSSDRAVMFSPNELTVAINIMDNESPQLTFSEVVYRFNETENEMQMERTETIVVNFGAETEDSHTWTLVSIPITATEGEDYSAINTSLQFDDNTKQRDVMFQIFDDDFSEGLESFRLELQDAMGGVAASGLVEIIDNENLLVSFIDASFTAMEGENLFFLEVNKSGITTSNISVIIVFRDIMGRDNMARGGFDYGVFPTPVFPAVTVILANETKVHYPVPIKNDDIVEKLEVFSASLGLRETDGTTILGNITEALIYIEDNDRVDISLDVLGNATVVEGNEGERILRLRVSRDENTTLDRDIVIVLTTHDVTALASSWDYEGPAESMFTFTPSGPTSFETSVSILGDITVEATEQFIIRLSAPSAESSVQLPENDTIITIIDDDKITVDFHLMSYTVSEGDGFADIILNKTGSNEIPVTVSVQTTTRDDTAEAGSDYNSTIQPLEFQTNETYLTLRIPLVDDDILENTERFTVILTVAVDDINVALGPRNVTSVTILDNDDVTVQFSESSYPVVEGEGLVSVEVVLSKAVQREVVVGVVTEDRTDGNDFVDVSETLTFSPGDLRKTLSISIISDDICENAETFSVRLSSMDPNVQVGGVNPANVTITDDDMCTVGFMDENITVREPESGEVLLELCVVRTGIIDRDLSLLVVTQQRNDIELNQRAIETVDFEEMRTFVTLPSTENNVCFNVTILSDERVEPPELFSIQEFPSADIISGRQMINVIIVDQEPVIDELPTVNLSSSTYTVMETAGMVSIELILTRPPLPPNTTDETILSVIFNTADGSAVAPEDYIAQTTTVIFEPSETSKSVEVMIVMDDVAEGIQTFRVFLTEPEGIRRLELGDVTEATVTITDRIDGKFANDTVVGDPFFIVPLNLTSDSHSFDEPPSLCFEIHGAADSFFNLVSDNCTSVNAYYQISSANEDLNFIRDIGVVTIDSQEECITIRVSVDNDCVPEVHRGNQEVNMSMRYQDAGVYVRRSGQSVRISVPNCDNSQLVMWVKCRNITGQPQLRFDITRGLNLKPTSHGLLGQFWNIPIHVIPFHFSGPVNYDLQRQELYLVEVRPQNSAIRRFVAEYHPVSWDRNRPEPCLYAGDQQGGRLLEIKSPNDPVIESNYRLYRTTGLFETRFRFSEFPSDKCGS